MFKPTVLPATILDLWNGRIKAWDLKVLELKLMRRRRSGFKGALV